jgi:hypothetical protein
MKKTRYSKTKGAIQVVGEAPGKLAETCWFVSSFVMSLFMGPFGVSQARLPAALPAIIAIFSLKIDGSMPMKLC